VEITCRVYRPRKPRESPLYQLACPRSSSQSRVERHLEELLRVWPARFIRHRGALRPVVERVLREFLECGLLQHGFARLWCGECRRSVLVAFSCRGRSFCPSCEKKRQLLWSEWLCKEVLAPVSHRHVVLTIPRLLFEAMDPLEWLARMSDHIPDPGQHRTLFYAEYSNRVRGSAHHDVPEAQAGSAPEPRRRCSPTWARMIAKVYHVDPLVCTRCGQRMSLIAFVTDQMAIGKILAHLGLSTPEAAKPPPPARELLRVAEYGDGWGVPAEWE
jgi:hypothetical protein